MRQDPFPRPGARVVSTSSSSPWWVGVALVVAMGIYFRSAGFLVGRWLDRHRPCSTVDLTRVRR